MGTTKTEHFTQKQNQIAIIAKALGHPARIAILEHLIKVNACICNDIVGEFPLAQPTISQHLKELRNANLIKGSIEKNAICYCINPTTFELISEYFSKFIIQKTNQNNC